MKTILIFLFMFAFTAASAQKTNDSLFYYKKIGSSKGLHPISPTGKRKTSHNKNYILQDSTLPRKDKVKIKAQTK